MGPRDAWRVPILPGSNACKALACKALACNAASYTPDGVTRAQGAVGEAMRASRASRASQPGVIPESFPLGGGRVRITEARSGRTGAIQRPGNTAQGGKAGATFWTSPAYPVRSIVHPWLHLGGFHSSLCRFSRQFMLS